MADIFEAIADPTRRKIMELLLTAQVGGLDEEEEGLAASFGEAGAKLGTWLTERAGWLSEQVKAKVVELDLNVDPKDLGRQLGRKLADAKVETEKSAKEFEKIARQKLDEVVEDVRTEAANVAREVKSRVKKKDQQ